MEIGKKIKAYLKEHGLKQNFLCEQLNVSDSTLSQMLSKNRYLPVEVYVKICEALKVDLDYFLKKGD